MNSQLERSLWKHGETVKSCRGVKLRSGDKLQKNKDPIYIRFLIRKLERKSNCCKNLLKQFEKIVLTSFCTQLSWNWSWNKGEKSIVNNGSCYMVPKHRPEKLPGVFYSSPHKNGSFTSFFSFQMLHSPFYPFYLHLFYADGLLCGLHWENRSSPKQFSHSPVPNLPSFP